MTLKELTIEGEIDKVQIAIERLKTFEPLKGYYLAFSGGKDSIVVYKLCEMSGVKFDTHFNYTTIDPPELIHFIRENYPDVIFERPKKSMFKLIEEKMIPPTRIMRYCCAYLKEYSGSGRFVVTGIRKDESAKRKKRNFLEISSTCKSKIFLHPIIDWKKKDIWDFIKINNMKYCSLYDEGFKRIGCILCPMQTKKGKLRDIEKYPKFYRAYLLAFKKMIKHREECGVNKNWKTPEEVMNWWVCEPSKQIQDTLFN